MALIRYTNRRQTTGSPFMPHIEQIALHATILTHALAVVAFSLLG